MFGGFPFHILWIPELPFHDCFIRVSCEHHFFSVLCITDALMDGRSPGMEHDPQTPFSSLPAPVCRVKRYAGRGHRSSPISPPSDAGFSKSASSIPSHLLNRWTDGRFSSGYRPPSIFPIVGPALAAPSHHRSPLGFQNLTIGGLQYTRPCLGVHARGFQPLVELPRPPGMGTKVVSPFRQLSTALVSEPVVGISASSSKVQSMHALHNQLKNQHLRQWLQLLEDAGHHSRLFQDTLGNEHSESHRLKAVAHYAPSTLSSYLRMWGSWLSWPRVKSAHRSLLRWRFWQISCMFSLELVLKVSHLGTFVLWLGSQHAVCQALAEVVQLPLIKSYSIAATPAVRREAAPLPLSFIIWQESCILSESMSEADRLVIGGILLLIWGSLRWSDGQWISPASLIENSPCLRGLARRTKSTNRGMPFGILRQDFLGHTVDLLVFTLDEFGQTSLETHSSSVPGFHPGFCDPTNWPGCGCSLICGTNVSLSRHCQLA